MTIRNSTFTNNIAEQSGGALSIEGTSTATISNSTFTGNQATTGAQQGGAITAGTSTVSIVNSTISGNSAANGGGLRAISGTITLSNTIIANNTAATGPDCSGTVNVADVLLMENVTDCTRNGVGSTTVADPLLGALAANGGPVQTMALLTGSPALNVGDAGACTALPGGALDARGIPRPQGAGCDLGAYEALQLSVANLSQGEGNGGTSTANVVVTLSQALPAGFPNVTVEYTTMNGSAIAPGDYTAVAGTVLTFTAGGAATQNAAVTVVADAVDEANESFTVDIGNAVRAVVGTMSATVTLTNDDAVVIVDAPPPAEDPPPFIDAPANTTTAAGVPFTLPLRAADGDPPYRWSVIGGELPPGLTLNVDSGAVTGTATTPGTFKATVRAIDRFGVNADLPITITIAGATGPITPTPSPVPVIPPVVTPPAPTLPGMFAGIPVFNTGGVASAVFAGGTTVQIEAAALAAGARGVWVQDGVGVFHLLVVGGPAFLQSPFIGVFPAGLTGPVAVFLVR